jgi:hypothetical protein
MGLSIDDAVLMAVENLAGGPPVHLLDVSCEVARIYGFTDQSPGQMIDEVHLQRYGEAVPSSDDQPERCSLEQAVTRSASRLKGGKHVTIQGDLIQLTESGSGQAKSLAKTGPDPQDELRDDPGLTQQPPPPEPPSPRAGTLFRGSSAKIEQAPAEPPDGAKNVFDRPRPADPAIGRPSPPMGRPPSPAASTAPRPSSPPVAQPRPAAGGTAPPPGVEPPRGPTGPRF